MKRGLGFGLAAILAVGVVVALIFGGKGDEKKPEPGQQLTQVRGLVGSEKKAYFDDPAVKQEFAKRGLSVTVDVAGSRDIANHPHIKDYDFVFPSSAPAADAIKANASKSQISVLSTTSPFHSPMAIATYETIATSLEGSKIAYKKDGHWYLDVTKYQEAVAAKKRWNELTPPFASDNAMLVITTDVRRSNSAAMWLALTSYVANGRSVVQNTQQARAVTPKVTPMFVGQGYSEGSSEAPFEDYLSHSVGRTPMVLIYESQFLDRQMRRDGSITKDMVLMYPTPDVVSKHTLMILKQPAAPIADLLTNDPALTNLEAKYGFRTARPAALTDRLTQAGVPQPPDLPNIVPTPTFSTMETLIDGVQSAYSLTLKGN